MAKITRRQILKGGIASALLVPVGYVTSVSIGNYPGRADLRSLTAKEATVLESVAEVVIPNENELGLTLQDVEFVKNADELIDSMPSYTQSRLRTVFWVVEHVLPLRGGHFRKFTKLNLDERTRILKALERSPWTASRAFFRALKGLVVAVFYNHPLACEKIGFVYRCS